MDLVDIYHHAYQIVYLTLFHYCPKNTLCHIRVKKHITNSLYMFDIEKIFNLFKFSVNNFYFIDQYL